MGLPTPLREDLARHADILVVRELAGGVYFGEPRGTGDDRGLQHLAADHRTRSRRVAHVAFKAARRRASRVTSVDKANVLEASRLWRARGDRGRAPSIRTWRSSTATSTP